MELNYNEMEERICYDIKNRQKRLEDLYKTIEETKEYGWVTTFNANDEEETIKTAYEYGRAIGEIEGEIDQLQSFLEFLHNKEMNI